MAEVAMIAGHQIEKRGQRCIFEDDGKYARRHTSLQLLMLLGSSYVASMKDCGKEPLEENGKRLLRAYTNSMHACAGQLSKA